MLKILISGCLLFLCSHQPLLASSHDYANQLEQAESIKSSDREEFSRILSTLESNLFKLSSEQKFHFYYLKGYKSAYLGQLNDALEAYQRVYLGASNLGLQYKSVVSLINLYAITKNWQKGFDLLDFILQSYEKISDPSVSQKGLLAVSLFYTELEQYNLSLDVIDRLKASKVEGRNKCLTSGFELKALLNISPKNLSREQFQDAINQCVEQKELVVANVIRSNLAQYYINQSENGEAISLLENNLSEVLASNYKLLIIDVYSLLSQAYFAKNHLTKAHEYAVQVIKEYSTTNYIQPTMKSYQVLYQIARLNGDFEKATDYLENYAKVEKLQYKEIKAKQLATELAKYQAIEKDIKIDLLNKQNKIAELKLETQKKMQIVWGVTFVSLAIIIFFWFYRRTAQKEIQRQKQVNWELKELDKLKDSILTNTSHELRTPLNGIIGLSDLILLEYEEEMQDELAKSIRLIGKSGSRLALLVNDLLDLAQLKSRRIKFNFQEFDLSEIIEDVVMLCKPLIKSTELKITYLNKNENLVVSQDKQRIQQVLFNLVGNAIKFTESGEVNVSCQMTKDHLLLNVSDTGIGIPEDKISRVFEGFEQVDNSNSRKHQGSGIGLAICREIVTALNGSIEIKSELGRGTIVSVTIPLLQAQELS